VRILVAALGGTIAMTGTGRGVAPTLRADDLLAAVPGLDRLGAELSTVTFRNGPSASLTVPDVLALYDLLAARFADGVDGAVITQGTDTVEETAYALDLLHRGLQPIVVTGAMRNPTQAGPDGPANLLAAITVAGTVRDLGCLVVLGDEIHAARRVRKTHTTSVATFASPDGGPLGYLVEGAPRIMNHPPRRAAVPHPGAEPLPLVGLVTATLGDDGALLPVFAEHLDGLVVAAFGVGHVPSGWPPVLEKIAARIPVVLTSRAGSGSVLSGTYDYPGSEQDLIRRGLVPGGFLHPYKARLLLQFLLAAEAGRDKITEAFATESGV
jgi:L-asparaginase